MSSVYCQSSCTSKSKPVLYPNSFKRDESAYVDERCTLFAYDAGHHGRMTVLDRPTGYGYGIRDVETGYRETYSHWRHDSLNFWLASGGRDIIRELSHGERQRCGMAWDEAVEWVKRHSNTVVGFSQSYNEAPPWYRGGDLQPRNYMNGTWQNWVAPAVDYSQSLRRKRDYGSL
ncbi:hypothetical protein CPT_MyoSmar_011 [Serratia phage MyoSmar]|uniref:Uncharacterized protein n=1 Tax=Serratia phage MyoSmar TaxID=2596673 RepID=A0A5B9NBT6_9CAUD|nr:hypothetical protein HWC56_gp011 [Serratia phage MyoSmar]QEG09460.1 hypothetical protein CPT_MyoSmar_011 [Serratia phage MyoSmar]